MLNEAFSHKISQDYFKNFSTKGSSQINILEVRLRKNSLKTLNGSINVCGSKHVVIFVVIFCTWLFSEPHMIKTKESKEIDSSKKLI